MLLHCSVDQANENPLKGHHFPFSPVQPQNPNTPP